MALNFKICAALLLASLCLAKSATVVPKESDDEPKAPANCTAALPDPDSIPVSDIIKYGTPVQPDTKPHTSNHSKSAPTPAHGNCTIPLPIELTTKSEHGNSNTAHSSNDSTVDKPVSPTVEKPLNVTNANSKPNETRHEKALNVAGESKDEEVSKNATSPARNKPEAMMMTVEHKPNSTTSGNAVVEEPIAKKNSSTNAAVPTGHETIDDVKPDNKTTATNATVAVSNANSAMTQDTTPSSRLDGNNGAPSAFYNVAFLAFSIFFCAIH